MELLEIMMHQIWFFVTALTVGFLAVKTGILTNDHVNALSKIMLGIIVPLLVLTIIVSSGTRSELFSMAPFALGVVIMFAVLIAVGFTSAKLLGYKSPLANTHVCSSAFVNSALLGYPIVIAMFPDESGLCIAVFLVTETLMMWTVGVGILTSGKDGGKIDFKKMVSPVTIALCIAIVMLLLDIHPKGIVWDSLTGIGATNKYLGLVYIGADIGRRGFKKLFEKPKVLFTIPTKLIAGPIAVFLVLRAINIVSYNQVIILTIFSMLPTMMLITMLAQEHNCCPEYASAALLSTTVASLVTMPVVFWLVTCVL